MSSRLVIGLVALVAGSAGIVGSRWAPALTAASAQARDPLAAQGQQVFMDQGCYGCHMVGLVGTPIGPDLTHEGAKHSPSYLTAWLIDPTSQKPTAHMPRISLTPFEVRALVAYLSTLQ